jgi:thiamine pyrophosphate-dependent acetolactate synthase large subunit-like protein
MAVPIHERIIDLLAAEGIDTIFGIPDPSFFAIFIHGEQRGMRVVAPHHEEAGAFMADALWRMTGKPGVMIGNKGPGVANLVAGAIHAAKENAPIVFIGGQRQRLYEQRVRRGKIQYLSQPRLFEASMKYVGIIEYPEQTDEIFHEAFRRALSGVPGPVYIDYPSSLLNAKFDLPPAPSPDRYRLVRQEAGTGAIADAVQLIKKSTHPMLLVGQGAFASRAHDAVAALARVLACPIVQTTGGVSVLEGLEDRTFAYGSPVAAEVVAKADVVIAVGTEIGEPLHYGRGRHWKKGNADRKWIYIERDPLAIGVNRPIDVPLVGDLRDVVPQLTAAVEPLERTAPRELAGWGEAHAAQARQLLESVPTNSTPIHPARLAVEATRVLPKDVVIVRDGGATSMFFGALLQLPPRDLMWNSNYGSVGPGLPYAVGAQLAVGNARRVVLLTGDSSFLFHIAELETAVRKKLPIVCIVGVDYAWGIEVASCKAGLGPDAYLREGHWGKEVRLDKTAESFGAYGEFVERSEDIAPAVVRALASGKPAVVHVVIDPVANSNMPTLPGLAEFRTWYGEEGDNLGSAVIAD